MTLPAPFKKMLPPAIVVLAIVITVTMIKLRPEPPKRPATFPVPLVETFTVPTDPATVAVEGFGTVRARRRITLVSEVAGIVTVKSPRFEAGEYFTADQSLLSIDETNYHAAVESAAAGVAQAELNLATAEEEAAVARREWQLAGDAAAGTTPPPLVAREPQLAVARANLTAAEAALARAEKDLSRCRLTTPFAGRVLSSTVDAGQFVAVGSTVGAIYATDVLEVIVPLQDADLAWIRATDGEQAGSVAILRADFAGGRHEWRGHVVRIGAAVDEASRQVPVIVEVREDAPATDSRPALIEGLFVSVTIEAEAASNAVAIPRALLRTGDTVWIIDSRQRIEIRPVTVARVGVTEIVIAAGLVAGERLCASNLQYVTQGMRIKLPGEAAADTSASPAGGQSL